MSHNISDTFFVSSKIILLYMINRLVPIYLSQKHKAHCQLQLSSQKNNITYIYYTKIIKLYLQIDLVILILHNVINIKNKKKKQK